MTHQRQAKFMLRLPKDWHEALKKRADRNHRSMHAEILFQIEPLIRKEMAEQES